MKQYQLQIKYSDDGQWGNDEVFTSENGRTASHYAGRLQKDYFSIKQFDVQVRAVPIDRIKEQV